MEEIEEGRLTDAIARLEPIDRRSLSPQARALVRPASCGRTTWTAMQPSDVLVEEVLSDRDRRSSSGTLLTRTDSSSAQVRTTLDLMVHRLEDLVRQHTEAELPYFAAVSLHNLTMAHLYRGDYVRAISSGMEAASLFEATGRARECHSTHAVLAICSAELGRFAEARGTPRLRERGSPKTRTGSNR